MKTSDGRGLSPQARGRELARLGKQLWQELGSVKSAAAELMNRNPDVPGLQAFRYAAGLSQDQAAVRYNEVANHQTSLGGTTINAWESWARQRGAGSPPPFSSLLMLAIAYGNGPLGVAKEEVSPSELVAEAYERLPPEDQISLRRFSEQTRSAAPASLTTEMSGHAPHQTQVGNLIGPEFNLPVPTIDYGNPEVCAVTLPNPRPGQLLDLTWETFGLGIERLARQIKNVGRRLDVDICFGINEAGLVMATFLASAQFARCAIGYLRCNKVRDTISLATTSLFPDSVEAPVILICDFEVKHADVIGFISSELRKRYPGAILYFAAFGAMTKGADLQVNTFSDLIGAQNMRAADLSAVFIAATMSPPGIEPPLELR
jgi:transcriptional regulator with XRE-family HTH domain